jgi:hypothetical protein
LGGAGPRRGLTFDKDAEDSEEEDSPIDGTPGDTVITIDGREVTFLRKMRDPTSFVPRRLWNMDEREHMTAEVKHYFIRAATAPVLDKNNRLKLPEVTSGNTKFLATVQNLQSQLKTLRNHMIAHDIYNVMIVVIPVNVQRSAAIECQRYNVLDDYMRLHLSHVANSVAWFNMWSADMATLENLQLTYTLLQNNIDPGLWGKVTEALEDYVPVQRGGPLAFAICLRLIHDSSEQALDHLRLQVKKIAIRDIPGEDVEQVVSLIKSTHKVLKSSGTTARTYVPLDFVKDIFKVFQTSSVREFNFTFNQTELEIQRKADLDGTRPQWPPVSAVLNLATNTYRRLKASGVWDGATRGKNKSSFTATSSGAGARTPAPSSRPQVPRKCWNCGGTDHMMQTCPKPKDNAKIQEARKRFMSSRGSRTGGGSAPSKPSGSGYVATDDIKPTKLNKNGELVIDQKAYKLQREAALKASTQTSPTVSNSIVAPTAAVATSTGPTTSSGPTSILRASQVRSRLRFPATSAGD